MTRAADYEQAQNIATAIYAKERYIDRQLDQAREHARRAIELRETDIDAARMHAAKAARIREDIDYWKQNIERGRERIDRLLNAH